jgi:hypothetical protein
VGREARRLHVSVNPNPSGRGQSINEAIKSLGAVGGCSIVPRELAVSSVNSGEPRHGDEVNIRRHEYVVNRRTALLPKYVFCRRGSR